MYNACTSITSIKHESSVQVRRCSTYIYIAIMPHTRGEKERGNEGIELGLLLGCYKVYVCVCVQQCTLLHVRLWGGRGS
jgi:hypothetical protein